jgi:GTP cyclohydrolase IB
MSHPTQTLHIPDTQSERDQRHLAIQRVGVKDVRYPLVLQVSGQPQHTHALWSLDVALSAEKKGTHMSRFVAWLESLPTPLTALSLREGLGAMLAKLEAQDGRIEAAFSFFIKKRAPVSGVQSLMDYQGRFVAEARGGVQRVWVEVAVPVKSLCPCSKEISDYGAHNQRSTVTIRAEVKQELPWHEFVRFAEDNASSELWSLLKRPDEKWVTERAYENPKFVEDLVRDVALALNKDGRVGAYVVEVENHESIHAHSAYAQIVRS